MFYYGIVENYLFRFVIILLNLICQYGLLFIPHALFLFIWNSNFLIINTKIYQLAIINFILLSINILSIETLPLIIKIKSIFLNHLKLKKLIQR